MRGFTAISFFFLFSALSIAQHKDVLLNRLTYTGIEHQANSLSDSSHTGLKPVMENRVNTSRALGYAKDTSVFYYDFTRWMLGSHLVDIKGKDFRLIVDPQFDFSRGEELKESDPFADTVRFFTNTRGFSIGADIGDKVSFQTRFYENLNGVPIYLRDHIRKRRSFPQQGRPKGFGQNNFDHAWAAGKVSWSPNDNLNFQFGNDRHFIGHGYRSVLLSDNAFNYPFIKGTAWFLKNKVQYTSIFAKLQTFNRLETGQSSENLFYWKRASFHHVSIDLNRIQLGFFEATHWETIDSNGVKPLNPMEWNPIIGANTIANGLASEHKQLLGIDLRFKATNDIMIYGQYATDKPSEGRMAYQAGIRWFDAAQTGIGLQLEYNAADAFMYTAQNAPMSHSHFGAEMAHPYGADFEEIVGIIDARFGKWLVSAKVNYANLRTDTANVVNYGNDIFKPSSSVSDGEPIEQRLIFVDAKVSYLLNPYYNMMFTVGYRYRDLTNAALTASSSYPYFAWHTNLFNRYYDF